MISDGDDPALDDHEWQEGIQAARAAGVPVHVIGIGDPVKGAGVPDRNGRPLVEDGQVVISRMQQKPLEEISRRTGGDYLGAATQAPRLGDFFRDRIEPRVGRHLSEDLLQLYRQRDSWFFGTALALLALEMLIGRRRKLPAPPAEDRPALSGGAMPRQTSSAIRSGTLAANPHLVKAGAP